MEEMREAKGVHFLREWEGKLRRKNVRG